MVSGLKEASILPTLAIVPSIREGEIRYLTVPLAPIPSSYYSCWYIGACSMVLLIPKQNRETLASVNIDTRGGNPSPMA